MRGASSKVSTDCFTTFCIIVSVLMGGQLQQFQNNIFNSPGLAAAAIKHNSNCREGHAAPPYATYRPGSSGDSARAVM